RSAPRGRLRTMIDTQPNNAARHSPPGGAAEGQPVVILLGWAGCQDRYLAKYSAIYSQKGCTVIRYTAPWRMIFFAESFGIRSLQTPARQLLELLFDHSIENRPILFHVFSNGGVMLYRYIVEALHTHRPFKSLRIAGTIFDSAPGRRNLRGGLRALATILDSMNLFHVFVVCFFFSLPFSFILSEQTEPNLQDFLLFSLLPSSCCTLLAGDQVLKPCIRPGKGAYRAV
uniref:Transmembrane protein 53 n=1 Tax=Malurus cyaneus samueli TaxID=2593467 RepID=A0A8C5TNC7_9PASS